MIVRSSLVKSRARAFSTAPTPSSSPVPEPAPASGMQPIRVPRPSLPAASSQHQPQPVDAIEELDIAPDPTEPPAPVVAAPATLPAPPSPPAPLAGPPAIAHLTPTPPERPSLEGRLSEERLSAFSGAPRWLGGMSARRRVLARYVAGVLGGCIVLCIAAATRIGAATEAAPAVAQISAALPLPVVVPAPPALATAPPTATTEPAAAPAPDVELRKASATHAHRAKSGRRTALDP
jgi:hypothetical protein